MQVVVAEQTFQLSESNVRACSYFDDIKEKEICLTELTQNQQVTSDEFYEFIRMLNDKPFDLSTGRLAFYAEYFSCTKAAQLLLADPRFSDLDVKLDFIRRHPISNVVVQATAQEVVPQVVGGLRKLSDLPSNLVRSMVRPLLDVTQHLAKVGIPSAERMFRRQEVIFFRARKIPEIREWKNLTPEQQAQWGVEHQKKVVERVKRILKPPSATLTKPTSSNKTLVGKKRKVPPV